MDNQRKEVDYSSVIPRSREVDYTQISQRIKEVRLEKNLTQEFLAQAADVNPSHISNIENNRVKVSLPTLIHICNALDVTVDYILSDQYIQPTESLEHAILVEARKCSNDTKHRLLHIIRALQ